MTELDWPVFIDEFSATDSDWLIGELDSDWLSSNMTSRMSCAETLCFPGMSTRKKNIRNENTASGVLFKERSNCRIVEVIINGSII